MIQIWSYVFTHNFLNNGNETKRHATKILLIFDTQHHVSLVFRFCPKSIEWTTSPPFSWSNVPVRFGVLVFNDGYNVAIVTECVTITSINIIRIIFFLPFWMEVSLDSVLGAEIPILLLCRCMFLIFFPRIIVVLFVRGAFFNSLAGHKMQ